MDIWRGGLTSCRRSGGRVRALSVLVLVGVSAARGDVSTQPAGRGTVSDPLAAKEQLVRDRMMQLEDRMFRLSEKLAATEPDQARRLEAALRQARELLIRRNMEETMALLEAGRLTEAADRQGQIIQDLGRILKILMEESDNTGERRKQIDQLQQFREQIRELLEQERELRSRSEAAPRLEQLMAAIRAAIARLEAMIQRQEVVLGQTQAAGPAENPTAAADLAARQKHLRQEAESLADALNRPMGAPLPAEAERPSDPAASDAGQRPADRPSGESPSRPEDSPPGSPTDQTPQAPGTPPTEKQPEPKEADARHESHDHEAHEDHDHAAPPESPSAAPPGTDRPGESQSGAPRAPEAPIEAGMRRAGSAIENASGQMKSAESALEKHQLAPAVPPQKQAVESLRKALAELKQQEEETRKLLDQAQAAKKQRELRQLARKLAQEMAPGREAGRPGEPQNQNQRPQQGGQQGGQQQGGQQQGGQQQGGQQQGGQQQGNQQPGGQQQNQGPQQQQPAPGSENVERAGEEMEQAAEKLEKENPHEAGENQQRSIEELEKAQQALDDALEQLRREQQEEILRGLESRFRAMLAQQIIINRGVQDLEEKGKSLWTHADELKLAGLSRDELKLADEAGMALHILREDGTSIVFPHIVEQLQGDIRELARLLGEKVTQEPSQALAAAIVTTLEELIEAIKQKREDLQQGGGSGSGGGGGGSQPQPLLPDSAELKLLKSCQERINRQTIAYEAQYGSGRTDDPELRRQLGRLAERQREVADMARKMNERATGQ